jgi:lipopolysaccharide biosynthesis regulator YciM
MRLRGWRRLRSRPSAAPPPGAAGPLRAALERALAGDLIGAERALAGAARLDATSADLYLALANLYRARGEIGRAIQMHQNLLLQSDLSGEQKRDALLGLAQDFRVGGFLRRSAASFEELLQVEPDHGEALAELEKIRAETGDFEAAIAIRRRIGSSDPETPRRLARLYVGLGHASAKAAQEAEARRAFRRALSTDRTCGEAWVALGEQRLREGKPARAIALWRRALPLGREQAERLYPRLFEAFALLGDYGGFERAVRERLHADADDARAALWLARALALQRRTDEALLVLRRLLDRAPGDLAVHKERGRILLHAGRDGDALKALDELLSHLPD